MPSKKFRNLDPDEFQGRPAPPARPREERPTFLLLVREDGVPVRLRADQIDGYYFFEAHTWIIRPCIKSFLQIRGDHTAILDAFFQPERGDR